MAIIKTRNLQYATTLHAKVHATSTIIVRQIFVGLFFVLPDGHTRSWFFAVPSTLCGPPTLSDVLA
jgi:hypothetical protein